MKRGQTPEFIFLGFEGSYSAKEEPEEDLCQRLITIILEAYSSKQSMSGGG